LVTGLQPLREKQADRIQRLYGRLDRSDERGKPMRHTDPHIEPRIDTSGLGALDVSS